MLPWILLVSAAVADLPPSAARPVDFARDIRPIFQRACLKCHGPEKQRGGLPPGRQVGGTQGRRQ